jgi:hypothetical protein
LNPAYQSEHGDTDRQSHAEEECQEAGAGANDDEDNEDCPKDYTNHNFEMFNFTLFPAAVSLRCGSPSPGWVVYNAISMMSNMLSVLMLFTESCAYFTPFSFIHRFARLMAVCLLLPSGINAPKSS